MKTSASKSAHWDGAQRVSPRQDLNVGASTGRLAPPCDGIVSGKVRRNQTDLDVESSVFGGSAVRGLIDGWLVPIVVDRITKDLICSGPADEEG